MTIPIPFSVEDTPQECLIQLRDLADQNVIFEIFHGKCDPGIHTVTFDPDKVPGGMEAGIYILHLCIGNDTSIYPVQFMP